MKRSLQAIFIFAAIMLCAGTAFALSQKEEARVNALLEALGKRAELIFIRNGKEYTSAEAVSHLRLKLSKTKNRLASAEQFVDKVASSSSVSGKPYLIKEPGKEARPIKPFLQELLKQAAP